MRDSYGVSVKRACALMGQSRTVYHYVSIRSDQAPLCMRIREIAASRVRYGYQRIHSMLRREGWQVNRKRALTVLDIYTRESLAIVVGKSLRGEGVVAALSRISFQRGKPAKIRCDNGSEFTSKALDKWTYEHGVEIEYSRPGKPTDNTYIESFNGRFREECLSTHWFLSLEDARIKIEAWRKEYNESRPHMSLDYMTHHEFQTVTSKINAELPLLDLL